MPLSSPRVSSHTAVYRVAGSPYRGEPSLQNGPLRLRVDADERLGDLDGVRRRTLEEVVGDAPVLDHSSLHAYPPDVGSILTGDLERRREVVRNLDARRRPKRFEHLRERRLALGLDVDALRVACVDRNPDSGREDGKVG